MNGAATSSAGSNVRCGVMPGSSASPGCGRIPAARIPGCRAAAACERSSPTMRGAVARRAECKPACHRRRSRQRSCAFTCPIDESTAPSPAQRAASSDRARRPARTWMTAPSSSLNSAASGLVIGSRAADVDHVDAAAAGEHHFAHRNEQAAIRAVVIGEYPACGIELLDCAEKRAQQRRIVDVRRDIADLAVYLRQRRAAQPVLARAEIDQDQLGIAAIGAQLRRQRLARIAPRARTPRRSATAAR